MVNFPEPKPFEAAGAARYAIYFAPSADTPLHAFGSRWLGRDAITGQILEQPAVPGIAPDRLAELTASARHYGFHATLKPPFQLKPGTSEANLLAAAETFAQGQAAFEIRLAVKSLAGFLALMQSPSRAEMRALAAACVRDLDHLRALPGPEELNRRREAGLSAQQENLLQRWGYPYVMDEFRFHMTLSARMPEGEEREALMATLYDLSAEVTGITVPVDAITVFRQNDRASPFITLQRCPFGR